MIREALLAGALGVGVGVLGLHAQTARPVPRPPAQAQGAQPAGESAAPDGYQPVPQWLGQTRASVPAKTAAYEVQPVVDGVNGAWFQFLPDGRIIVAEKNGRIRIVGKDGKLSDPLGGMPRNMYAAGQSLYSVSPDRHFAANRTIYLAYAVLPEGVDASKQRTPSHVHIASAKISSD